MVNQESKIIQGCLDGNRSAQETLYRDHAGRMFAICKSYAKDNDAAKDLLQKGFIKVFKNIHQFQHEGEIGAWIRRIMVNTCLDYCRKVERERSVALDNIKEAEFAANNITDNVYLADLVNIVRSLPEKARMVFNLYVVEGYSHKEIAVKLNISEGTSKSQFSRARKLLQERIPHYYDI